MANAFGWVEIPAVNFERAVAFYSALYGHKIEPMAGSPTPYAFLVRDMNGVGGAIMQSNEKYTTGQQGPLVYLTTGRDINEDLPKIESAGGKVLEPKTAIGGDMGYYAVFLDSEGNRLGLHSMM